MEFKNKSRLTTIIGGILTSLSIISVETWHSIIPVEYQYIIPVLIALITTGTAQYTEETRVEVVRDKYTSEDDTDGI